MFLHVSTVIFHGREVAVAGLHTLEVHWQAFQCVCGQPGAASVKICEVPVKAQDTGVGS